MFSGQKRSAFHLRLPMKEVYMAHKSHVQRLNGPNLQVRLAGEHKFYFLKNLKVWG